MWAPKPVRTFWKREKSPVPTRIRTLDHSARNLEAIPNTLPRLLLCPYCKYEIGHEFRTVICYDRKYSPGVYKFRYHGGQSDSILRNGPYCFSINISFSFQTYKNVYQFTRTEQKAPDNDDNHRLPQNCGLSVWSLLKVTLLAPRIRRWLIDVRLFLESWCSLPCLVENTLQNQIHCCWGNIIGNTEWYEKHKRRHEKSAKLLISTQKVIFGRYRI